MTIMLQAFKLSVSANGHVFLVFLFQKGETMATGSPTYCST